MVWRLVRMGVLVVLGACSGPSKSSDVDASVDVSPDTPQGTPVNITLENEPIDPVAAKFFVAYQDGTDGWRAAPAPAGDTYTLYIKADAWAFLYTCLDGGASFVQEFRFTVSELTSMTIHARDGCRYRDPTVTLSGAISDTALAGLVEFGPMLSGFSGGSYSMKVLPGTADLLGVAGSGSEATHAFIKRDVAVSAATSHDVDAATEVKPLQEFTASFGAATAVGAATTIFTAGGTKLRWNDPLEPYVVNTLDAAQARSGDMYIGIIVASNGANMLVGPSLSAMTFSAPVPISMPTSIVAATTPYPIVETTWPLDTLHSGFQLRGDESTDSGPVWDTFISKGVAIASPSYRTPDLSAVPGWSQNFQFRSGGSVDIQFYGFAWSGGVSDFATITAGAMRPTAPTQGTNSVVSYFVAL